MEWLQRLRKLFPEVPAELLGRVLPDDQFDPELLPWNRHVRRRLKKADEIILHLFSGPDERTWKELETKDRRVLCVDMELHRGQNLLAKHVAAYILHLCLSGKVRMILAGPPCRTVSRLRHTQPGPPPLRTRFGATRFGRDNLSDQLRSMVADDTVLFLRALTYYVVAEESAIERPKRGPAVGYAVESPQDPESYAPEEEDEKKCPSFWAFPERKAFAEAFGMMLISFDQGPMGHERRKPTSVGTNLVALKHLGDPTVLAPPWISG